MINEVVADGNDPIDCQEFLPRMVCKRTGKTTSRQGFEAWRASMRPSWRMGERDRHLHVGKTKYGTADTTIV